MLVWYFYFALVAQAFTTGDLLSLIISIFWLFAILMVFPIFKGGGI